MAHIDYEQVATLDALIDVSDAAARATLVRLRERLARLGDFDQRVVFDSAHKKPAIAFYRGDEALLHVFPEPGVGLGLHVAVPIPAHQRDMVDARRFAPWLADAFRQARRRKRPLWVEATLHSPRRADELIDLLARRLALLPQ
jgi:hypothetical protein